MPFPLRRQAISIMTLIIQDNRVPAFYGEGFPLPVPFGCWELIGNTNIAAGVDQTLNVQQTFVFWRSGSLQRRDVLYSFAELENYLLELTKDTT